MLLGVKIIIEIDFSIKIRPFQLVECYKRSILPNFPTVENGRGCIVQTMFLGVKIMIAIDFSHQETPISLVWTLKTANIKENHILPRSRMGVALYKNAQGLECVSGAKSILGSKTSVCAKFQTWITKCRYRDIFVHNWLDYVLHSLVSYARKCLHICILW